MHVYLHPIKRRNYLVTGDENGKKKKNPKGERQRVKKKTVSTLLQTFSPREHQESISSYSQEMNHYFRSVGKILRLDCIKG